MDAQPIISETTVFGGVNFIRYPEAKTLSDRRYFKGRWRINGKLVKTYLHRVMWIEANGPIPKGHHIHHKDGNHLNNTLENLECITAAEHLSNHYAEKSDEWKAEKTTLLITVAQEAAKAWHKSEEGRAWFSEQSKRNWQAKATTTETCTVCGTTYETKDARKTSLKYCSINCNAAQRRASGKDDETRQCACCGKDFVVGKYQKTQNCSRTCGAGSRKANALAKQAGRDGQG